MSLEKNWNSGWNSEKENLVNSLAVSNLSVNPTYLDEARCIVFGILTKKYSPRLIVNEDGYVPSWNSASGFYSPGLAKDNRLAIFRSNLEVVGDRFGFSPQLASMIDQTKLKDFNSFKVLNLDARNIRRFMKTKQYYKDGMIWNVDKPGHAIIMKKDEYDKIVRNTGLYPAIMHPAADCIVTIVEDPDNGFIAILHSGYKEIASGMPYAFFKYLENKCGTNLSHLKISIGPAAWEGQVFSDEKLPSEIKQSEIWLPEFTISKDGKNEIKTGKAYFNQLINAFGGVENVDFGNIVVDPRNTLYEEDLYTHAGSLLRDDAIDGRNLYVASYRPPKRGKNGVAKSLGTMHGNNNVTR